MEVEGSFDNWSTRQHMQKSGKDFTIIKLLPPGVYQVTHAAKHIRTMTHVIYIVSCPQGGLGLDPQPWTMMVGFLSLAAATLSPVPYNQLGFPGGEPRLCVSVPQYKFIVDGEWKYAPDQPAMHDERDIINNVVEVQEYVPDHLDSLVGFEPPPSPVERCPTAALFLEVQA